MGKETWDLLRKVAKALFADITTAIRDGGPLLLILLSLLSSFPHRIVGDTRFVAVPKYDLSKGH